MWGWVIFVRDWSWGCVRRCFAKYFLARLFWGVVFFSVVVIGWGYGLLRLSRTVLGVRVCHLLINKYENVMGPRYFAQGQMRIVQRWGHPVKRFRHSHPIQLRVTCRVIYFLVTSVPIGLTACFHHFTRFWFLQCERHFSARQMELLCVRVIAAHACGWRNNRCVTTCRGATWGLSRVRCVWRVDLSRCGFRPSARLYIRLSS